MYSPQNNDMRTTSPSPPSAGALCTPGTRAAVWLKYYRGTIVAGSGRSVGLNAFVSFTDTDTSSSGGAPLDIANFAFTSRFFAADLFDIRWSVGTGTSIHYCLFFWADR